MRRVLVAVVTAAVVLTACETMELEREKRFRLAVSGLQVSDVGAAIAQAAKESEWKLTPKGERQFEAEFTRGDAWVKVQLSYDQLGVNVSYVDSRSLNYDGYYISSQYDQCLNQFVLTVRQQLSSDQRSGRLALPESRPAVAPEPSATP